MFCTESTTLWFHFCAVHLLQLIPLRRCTFESKFTSARTNIYVQILIYSACRNYPLQGANPGATHLATLSLKLSFSAGLTLQLSWFLQPLVAVWLKGLCLVRLPMSCHARALRYHADSFTARSAALTTIQLMPPASLSKHNNQLFF
jgi:hypothetical protein